MALTLDQILLAILLVAMLVLFITEALRAELVALSVMVVLMVLGLVTPEEGVSGFSNPATITVLALFIVSAGVNRTGVVDALARRLVRVIGGSETRALVAILLIVAPTSAFLNNTAVVAILLPLVVTLAEFSKTSPSKLLMPLSQFAMMAGAVTVIGTSTNVLASTLVAERLGRGFGMFEFAKVGLVALGVGALYVLLLGRHLVPARVPVAGPEHEMVREFVTEARLLEGSPLVGQPLHDHPVLAKAQLDVLRILRAPGNAEETKSGSPLRAGDVLVLRANRRDLAHLEQELKVELLAEVSPEDVAASAQAVVEVVVAPTSSLVRRTLVNSDLAREFGVKVLGLRKLRPAWVPRVAQERLEFGDTLLVLADDEAVARLKKDPDLIVVDERAVTPLRPQRAAWALAIGAGVVAAAAIGLAPILVTSLAGAVLMVLVGLLDASDLWTSVRWDVVFLMAGLIPLGVAMESTGLAGMLGAFVYGLTAGLPDVVLVTAFYLTSMLLTAVLSNNANIVLLTPVAFSTALAAGLDPIPLVLAIMFASSYDFNTPIGYQTNLMVYGPGGYRFIDYARSGLPLSLILALVVPVAILYFFPIR